MMIDSQQMGIKHRLQIELVNFLQDETIGIAKRVTNQTTALDDLKTKTGMTWRVPDVGPAFQGKGHGTIKVGDGAVTPQIDEVIREGMYAVPTGVADTLEQIWRGGTTNFNKVLNVSIPIVGRSILKSCFFLGYLTKTPNLKFFKGLHFFSIFSVPPLPSI